MWSGKLYRVIANSDDAKNQVQLSPNLDPNSGFSAEQTVVELLETLTPITTGSGLKLIMQHFKCTHDVYVNEESGFRVGDVAMYRHGPESDTRVRILAIAQCKLEKVIVTIKDLTANSDGMTWDADIRVLHKFEKPKDHVDIKEANGFHVGEIVRHSLYKGKLFRIVSMDNNDRTGVFATISTNIDHSGLGSDLMWAAHISHLQKK